LTLAPPRGFSRAQLEEAPDSGEQLAAPGYVAFPGSSTRASRMRSQRFELKYWIPDRLAERVLAFAAPYVERDAHSATRASQRNTTLYLDSRGFHFFESHEALAPDRAKLRIRAYGQPLGALGFLEVKRKLKSGTHKSRCSLPLAQVENVLGGRRLSCCLPEDTRPAFGDFMFRMHVHRAQPQLYIGCFREAFESRIPGEDVRLTIDRELVYQAASGARFDPDPARWLALRDAGDARPVFGRRPAMLELKFDGSAPRWMVELVRCFNLQREAYSKYVAAVRQLRGRT